MYIFARKIIKFTSRKYVIRWCSSEIKLILNEADDCNWFLNLKFSKNVSFTAFSTSSSVSQLRKCKKQLRSKFIIKISIKDSVRLKKFITPKKHATIKNHNLSMKCIIHYRSICNISATTRDFQNIQINSIIIIKRFPLSTKSTNQQPRTFLPLHFIHRKHVPWQIRTWIQYTRARSRTA